MGFIAFAIVDRVGYESISHIFLYTQMEVASKLDQIMGDFGETIEK